MAGRLAGRVAFITGSGMGIGREAAVLFAEEGAGVVVADIDAKAAKETVALVERRGGRAPAPTGDVAIETGVPRLVEDGARPLGRAHRPSQQPGAPAERPHRPLAWD